VDQLSIIADSADRAGDIGRQLAGFFDTRLFPRYGLPRAKPDKYTVVDVDLEDASHLVDLRLWLNRRPKGGKAIFAVEHGIRHQEAQAYAIGATDLVHRPINRKVLLTKFWGDFKSLAGDPAELSQVPEIVSSAGITSAIGALQGIFAAACGGAPLDQAAIDAAGDAIAAYMATEGLAPWIDTVRRHHSQTYQHSLVVTGVAVGFGRHLGLSNADQRQLSFAGLLHDIGKARIPVSLLEKPGPLNRDETRVMSQHPLFGFEALERMPDIPADMIDAVVHHHEYLDGSGYPHGLQGGQISDIVRILTIADIFGALLERRSYRAAMPIDAAYRVLLDMGPKLDADLVREFKTVARLAGRPV